MANKSVNKPTVSSLRSRFGLNAANFFIAEVTGVIVPFLGTFLRKKGWHYDGIGLAVALSGLGVFILQTPAGFLIDRITRRRELVAVMSLVLGIGYGILPTLPARAALVDPLLFVTGAASAFFAPALAAIALTLVGRRGLDRMIGTNQSWNHAGNIAAALLAVVFVRVFGVAAVFEAVFVASILGAVSVFLIEAKGGPKSEAPAPSGFRELLRDPRVLILLVSTALFHLANAPAMPLVALDLKRLGGGDSQVAMVVLIAQCVMIPVAWLAGRYCARGRRKPVFAVGFLILPIRIFLYSRARTPAELLALQTLDGIGAGIYGVLIVSVCADLTREKGHFNALLGAVATALALGGVIGPLLAGGLAERWGFATAFEVLAAVALAGAVLFVAKMPETGESGATDPVLLSKAA